MRVAQTIQVNGHYRHFNEPVKNGDLISLTYDELVHRTYVPETPHLNTRYEDDDLLIVDNPPHENPPKSTWRNRHLNESGCCLFGSFPALITHRLDMATGGLFVIAKNPLAQAIINRQLTTKTMHRDYLAVVPSGFRKKERFKLLLVTILTINVSG